MFAAANLSLSPWFRWLFPADPIDIETAEENQEAESREQPNPPSLTPVMDKVLMDFDSEVKEEPQASLAEALEKVFVDQEPEANESQPDLQETLSKLYPECSTPEKNAETGRCVLDIPDVIPMEEINPQLNATMVDLVNPGDAFNASQTETDQLPATSWQAYSYLFYILVVFIAFIYLIIREIMLTYF